MVAIHLPTQLQDTRYRFVLVRNPGDERTDKNGKVIVSKGKDAFEFKWSEHPHVFDGRELLWHLAVGKNYGVIAGHGGLVLLDFDDMKIRERVLGVLPPTFLVRTGSGKLHAYYCCDEMVDNIRVNDVSDNHRLLDVQGCNTYVVGPGSLHESGERYRVEKDVPIASVSKRELSRVIDGLREKPRTDLSDLRIGVVSAPDVGVVRDALRVIPSDDYDVWMRVGMALKNLTTTGVSEVEARGLWDEWSRKSSKYDGGVIDGKWESFEADVGERTVTVGSIFHEAGRLGWQKPAGLVEPVRARGVVTPSMSLDAEEDETEVEIAESKASCDFGEFTREWLGTGHLKYFSEMDADLGLKGDELLAFKKNLWYYHHSALQPTTVGCVGGRFWYDNRIHLLCIASPSSGKSTVKNQIKELVPKEYVIETSGLSHPEQLVGKTIHSGKGPTRSITTAYGILSYPVVLYDEAQTIINEDTDINAAAQRLKRGAMDTYGKNEVCKKLTEDLHSDILRYYSPSRVFDFMHPVKFKSAFFDTGSFRRYNIHILKPDTVIDIKALVVDFLTPKKETAHNYVELMRKEYQTTRNQYEFDVTTMKIVGHYYECLLSLLLNHENKTAFRYGLLRRYDLRNAFLKNVLILTLAHNEAIVKAPSQEITIQACKDTCLFTLRSIESINEQGSMGMSSDIWGGLKEEDIQACEYLWRKKAITRDTSTVSIRKFWTVLAHLYGCAPRQSRAHFYRLKKDGYVDSHQVGKHGSSVWLTFVPQDFEFLNANVFVGFPDWVPSGDMSLVGGDSRVARVAVVDPPLTLEEKKKENLKVDACIDNRRGWGTTATLATLDFVSLLKTNNGVSFDTLAGLAKQHNVCKTDDEVEVLVKNMVTKGDLMEVAPDVWRATR